jgi:hypothetical protein
VLINDLLEDFTFICIYIIIVSIFQKVLSFPSKKLVFEKIFKNNFNIAENKIISVEATNVEHIIKCETI